MRANQPAQSRPCPRRGSCGHELCARRSAHARQLLEASGSDSSLQTPRSSLQYSGHPSHSANVAFPVVSPSAPAWCFLTTPDLSCPVISSSETIVQSFASCAFLASAPSLHLCADSSCSTSPSYLFLQRKAPHGVTAFPRRRQPAMLVVAVHFLSHLPLQILTSYRHSSAGGSASPGTTSSPNALPTSSSIAFLPAHVSTS